MTNNNTILLFGGTMISSRYETHNIKNSVLPFIFHPSFKMSRREKIPNWHKNIEFLQCVEGEGFVRCDTTVIPLKKNSIVTVNSDVLHSIGTDSELEYRCLILDNDFLISNGIPADELTFQSYLDAPEAVEQFNQVCKTFTDLKADNFKSVANLRCEVMRFCVALCEFSQPQAPSTEENNYVKEAIYYIRQHISEPISLAQLSLTVGVSKFHLARQFKKYTGNSIIQTVNRMRCAEAQRMLEQGESVSAVAVACGFSNHSYFSKTFYSIMGKLPSQV